MTFSRRGRIGRANWVGTMRARRWRAALLTLSLTGTLTAAMCDSGVLLPPNTGTLAVGTWGGANAGVIVNDTLAHVHVGCTYGDIPGRVSLSSGGSFTRAGSFLLRAYPVAIGPTMPAQFVGRVDGAVLTLTVTVSDTIAGKTTVLGPVSVTYNKDPQLGPCPICAVPGRRSLLAPAR